MVFKLFGLVKFYEFLFSFFKLLNAGFLKKTGYTLFNLFDAFSVASVFLVVSKLILRISEINPSWKLNLLILTIGTGISLKLELISIIRNIVRSFWMLTLGKRFYYAISEEDTEHAVYYLGWDNKEILEDLKIPEMTILNKIFQEIFYFY